MKKYGKIYGNDTASNSALARGINYLLTLQQDDGRFEGQLSASTFPSCAYAWIQLAQGETPSSEQIAWFINTQNEEGAWDWILQNSPIQMLHYSQS